MVLSLEMIASDEVFFNNFIHFIQLFALTLHVTPRTSTRQRFSFIKETCYTWIVAWMHEYVHTYTLRCRVAGRKQRLLKTVLI